MEGPESSASEQCASRKARQSPGRGPRFLRWLALANLLFAVALLVLVFVVSERWWPGIVVTYAPRAFALIPSLILAPFCLFFDRWRSATLIALAMVLVAVVVMEFNIPRHGKRVMGASNSPFRVVSWNLQRFEGDFETTLEEILSSERDVVIIQEVIGPNVAKLKATFRDWHLVSKSEYWVASRYPARLAGVCYNEDLKRFSGIAVEIDHPEGPVIAFNLHPRTARFGLKHLYPNGSMPKNLKLAIRQLENLQAKRVLELEALRRFVDDFSGRKPTLIAGDFNAPASSSMFSNFWGDYVNVFSAHGWGYGYTAPCDGPGGLPHGMPWIRIDHILVDDSWAIARADVGKRNGSDHRMVSADLELVGPSTQTATPGHHQEAPR